jgi:purine-binding chemotaxis protein CheW
MQAANEAIRKQGSAAMSTSEESSDFLTFTLGREEYGIDILKVQEIRGYNAVTAIANAPAFLKGVINLRGTIVPIVDLRIKFNLEQVVYDQFTVVIILNVMSRVVGAVIDSVSDVLRLNSEQIRAAPEFGPGMDTKYITGIGAVDDRMLILIDIEKLMASPDMALTDDVEELGT